MQCNPIWPCRSRNISVPRRDGGTSPDLPAPGSRETVQTVKLSIFCRTAWPKCPEGGFSGSELRLRCFLFNKNFHDASSITRVVLIESTYTFRYSLSFSLKSLAEASDFMGGNLPCSHTYFGRAQANVQKEDAAAVSCDCLVFSWIKIPTTLRK